MLLQKLLETVFDGVAGHEKHPLRRLGLTPEQFLGKIDAVEAGHLPVGDDDVVVVAEDQFQGGFAGAGGFDPVALAAEDFLDEAQAGMLVIDDEEVQILS